MDCAEPYELTLRYHPVRQPVHSFVSFAHGVGSAGGIGRWDRQVGSAGGIGRWDRQQNRRWSTRAYDDGRMTYFAHRTASLRPGAGPS